MHVRQYIIAALSLAATLLILTAPSLPEWGIRHAPGGPDENLTVGFGHKLGQSFTPEYAALDTIVIWLDPAAGWPQAGSLLLELTANSQTYTANQSFADVTSDGRVIFTFDKPIEFTDQSSAQFFVTPERPGQKVSLRYQIDGSKYEDGEMIHFNQRLAKQGDLAFHARYQRPALGSRTVQWGYAAIIVIAGLLTAGGARRTMLRHPRGIGFAATSGVLVTLFYFVHLWQPGYWVATADFVKDTSYVITNAGAVKAGAWPVWSHYTCGGMSALGNPEGNTVSLATVLGLAFPPERALWLLLAIEAGLGAAGAYLLARALKLSNLASFAAVTIYTLSGHFAYRIVAGFTMLGGAIAFIPWVFLGLLARKPLLAGLAIAAMLLRGDVHVVIGVIVVVTVWQLYDAIRSKTFNPIKSLLVIGAVTVLFSSIKILPYLEQPDLIGGALHPYVVPILQENRFNQFFLKVTDADLRIPALHSREPLHFHNFGSYVGIIPFVLAAIGLFSKNRHRTIILIAAATSFILSEGWLFEVALRHFGPLDVLLRIPARLLPIFVLFLGLLAGFGIDRIKQPRLSAVIVIFLVIDLALASSTILTANLWHRTTTVLPTPTQPTLSPHVNFSRGDKDLSSTLLRSGYILPHICGDQNNPQPFVADITSKTPISSAPATLVPNGIEVTLNPNQNEYNVKERFTSSVVATQGTVLPAADGSIDLILPKSHTAQSATVIYTSPTKRAQQILLVLLLVTLSTLAALALRTSMSRRTRQKTSPRSQ